MLAFPVLKCLRKMHEDGHYLDPGNTKTPLFQWAVLKGPPLPLDCSCGFMDSGEGTAQGFGEPCVHQVANPSRGPRGASAGRTHKAKDSQSPPPGMASHELTAQLLWIFHGCSFLLQQTLAKLAAQGGGCFSTIPAGALRCVYAQAARIRGVVGAGANVFIPRWKLVSNSKWKTLSPYLKATIFALFFVHLFVCVWNTYNFFLLKVWFVEIQFSIRSNKWWICP